MQTSGALYGKQPKEASQMGTKFYKVGDETITVDPEARLIIFSDPIDLNVQVSEILADRERLAERCERLEAALRMAREELAGLPRSLGYEFTHLPKIDEALSGSSGGKDG